MRGQMDAKVLVKWGVLIFLLILVIILIMKRGGIVDMLNSFYEPAEVLTQP